jgi:UDP-glucose 4-epimerase
MFGVFLAQLANGKPLTIVGDGRQERDFTHVSDVVNAFVMASKADVSGVFNVGTGSPESVNYIAKLIGGEKVHIPKRPAEPDKTQADITKIRTELGWAPKVSIEDGVKELLQDAERYKDWPCWEPDMIAEATKTWFEKLA